MSIPGAFQPVELDGMLVNNIPIGLAFEMGADMVGTVDVGTPLRLRPNSLLLPASPIRCS